MKAISVYDLKIIPELAHLNYFELVHPDNDCLVNPFLGTMGFDLDYPLMYTVSQHRTLQNTVVIGYVIRGEVNISREHLTGPWGTLYDRMVAAAYTDPSLCVDLCRSMNMSLDQSAFIGSRHAADSAPENFPECLTNPDEKEILEQIQLLESILFDIRGSQYRLDGSLKMPDDYHTPEVEPKARKKHVRKKLTLGA
jgi:hypothetical protein